MKIIFLDIDGVLNSELYFRGYCRYPSTTIKHPQNHIDRGAVETLNTLIKNTDAKVVVSSTWRLSYSKEELQGFLNEFGFAGEVIGVTPDYSRALNTVRGNEILGWIRDNDTLLCKSYDAYAEYVILDDDTDMLFWQRNNFVHVDRYCGITPTIVRKATRILNNCQGDVRLGI